MNNSSLSRERSSFIDGGATKLIDRLVDKGLDVRFPSDENHRVVLMQIKGRGGESCLGPFRSVLSWASVH